MQYLFAVSLAVYSLYNDSNQKRDSELKKALQAAISEHRQIVELIERKFIDQLLKGVKVSTLDFTRKLRVHLDFRKNEIDLFNAEIRRSIEDMQSQVILRKRMIDNISKELNSFNKALTKGQGQFSKYIKEAQKD